MDISKIHAEMTSEALKELSGSVDASLNSMRDGKTEINQTRTEIAAAKHILQALSLDWTYHNPRSQEA